MKKLPPLPSLLNKRLDEVRGTLNTMKRRDFMAGLTGTTIGATTAATANSDLRFKHAQSTPGKIPSAQRCGDPSQNSLPNQKNFQRPGSKMIQAMHIQTPLVSVLIRARERIRRNVIMSFTVGASIFLITACKKLRPNHRSRSNLKNSGKLASAVWPNITTT